MGHCHESTFALIIRCRLEGSVPDRVQLLPEPQLGRDQLPRPPLPLTLPGERRPPSVPGNHEKKIKNPKRGPENPILKKTF